MNRVLMDEEKVFDACALVEEIASMTDLRAIRIVAGQAEKLLNEALEGGELVGAKPK